MTIAIIHAGHSGVALAAVLGQVHSVRLQDSSPHLVKRINDGDCPIACRETVRLIARGRAGKVDLDLKAVHGVSEACKGAEFVIVTTPPVFGPATGRYDTLLLERDIAAARAANASAWIVVRTRVPQGFTQELAERTHDRRLLFSPEFVREHAAHELTANPDRVTVGCDLGDPEAVEAANRYADVIEAATSPRHERIVTGLAEAEAIKLFSDHYQFLHTCFINELDAHCASSGLDVRSVMAGMSLDGSPERNPTIGCDGSFAPNETKALMENYPMAPQALIDALVTQSNSRLDFIAREVMREVYHRVYSGGGSPVVGIFQPAENGFDPYCETSGLLGLISRIDEKGIPTLVYEPRLPEGTLGAARVTHDLEGFKRECTLIVSNRQSSALDDVRDKVYTRDLGQ